MGALLQTAEIKRRALGAQSLRVRVEKPGTGFIHEGLIEYVMPGEVSIFLNHRFPRETQLRVNVNGFQFDGTVVFSEPKGHAFETHIVIADTDETGKRKDPRYIVNLPARLHSSLSDEPLEVRLVDVSRDGVGLESPLKLAMGESVAIESQSNLAFGSVRHCRELPSGKFRAGILVDNVITREADPVARQERRSWFSCLLPQRP